MAKITIFGLAGTGTSSTGKMLAEKLGYTFMSSGNMFRKMAEETNHTLKELEELSKKESKYDIELDQKIKKFGEENNNFIVESRLAWYFIPDSLKIKLTCDFDARIERIANREGISAQEAKEHTIHREEAIFERYARYYGITDFSDDKFDLVINNTDIPLSGVVEKIENFIKSSSLLPL
ncbi:hypothetical protein A3B18_02590 [Candidatus Giovannonibacteria bacterium RIFCSPLOWO2_01_FULL_46_13]|uniref:Uncharacterized protein n=1 Tax=Candidatus Giovannonibacteria bacterium RIFCSPLOWO2_01_FULL_46_13 TaxID=1798352 RepID=A0A1F5X538_9BACT|nr:MAG: hypothetical protein A3B18_02590 [Candidatus Giovannonibacteria bacterium RIFCSPLOWO2_01_FULL_46_13]